ncbi:MAG TPA: FliA/WhiG family RNA polymerase sigma factor [Verrucomicrobiae bacterium]|nr:FliA/WhiG family RNA polymerase sigma factor [Verrucomicrobiae bacterium]
METKMENKALKTANLDRQNSPLTTLTAADFTGATTALIAGRNSDHVTQKLQNFPSGPELWELYKKQSGTDTENALVECYLPLVGAILNRLAGTLPDAVDRQDLYSAGLLGLLAALRKFNPATGVPFDSYARQRIRGAMLDEIRRMDWVPRAIRAKARQFQMAYSRLEQELGRSPTRAESAQALEMTMTEYDELIEEIRPAQFINLDSAGDSEQEGDTALGEVFAQPDQISPFEQTSSTELKQIILAKLRQMPQIQQRVLTLYYIEGLYLHEIATTLKLTEGRICQIHSQALQVLRGYMKRFENGVEESAMAVAPSTVKNKKRAVRIQDRTVHNHCHQ